MLFRVVLDRILEPLQLVSGAVDRRQLVPILSFLYCKLSEGSLTLIGSDQEVEISSTLSVDANTDQEAQDFTLPGRKLMDICRNLNSGSEIELQLSGSAVQLVSGRFKSHFSVLPPADFPQVEMQDPEIEVSLPVSTLKKQIDRVAFAMAQQDVRYFFNGMLFEFSADRLRLVATNGQRLALSDCDLTVKDDFQAIVPRKAVIEIQKLLKGDETVTLKCNRNHMSVEVAHNKLVTKLIDATFPDYFKAIPDVESSSMVANRLALKSSLSRISILSNELYRNVKLVLEPSADTEPSANDDELVTEGECSNLCLMANNPLQEEAEETLAVEYSGEALEIGFNVVYLMDVLGATSSDSIEVGFIDSTSPILIRDPQDKQALYVVSPMMM